MWKKVSKIKAIMSAQIEDFRNEDKSLTLACSDCRKTRPINEVAELIGNPMCQECGSNNVYLQKPEKAIAG